MCLFEVTLLRSESGFGLGLKNYRFRQFADPFPGISYLFSRFRDSYDDNMESMHKMEQILGLAQHLEGDETADSLRQLLKRREFDILGSYGLGSGQKPRGRRGS